jgi:hypothetical protein
MTTRLAALAIVVGGASAAVAQPSPGIPQYPDPFSFGPTNPYNRASQPLSPYLNLLRGGNPGVNYFYGVRPGTTGGGGFGGGAPMMAQGAQRAPFFPPQAQAQDPAQVELPGLMPEYKIPSPAHPVVFNNTLGYFPGPGGGRAAGAARPATQQSGGRAPAGARR